jgi:prophage maintenance system killer protein
MFYTKGLYAFQEGNKRTLSFLSLYELRTSCTYAFQEGNKRTLSFLSLYELYIKPLLKDLKLSKARKGSAVFN